MGVVQSMCRCATDVRPIAVQQGLGAATSRRDHDVSSQPEVEMSATAIEKSWKNSELRDEDAAHPAGVGFGELTIEDLREDRTIYAASSGWICTLTIECGTIVCACQPPVTPGLPPNP
jgi:hypothetical protein